MKNSIRQYIYKQKQRWPSLLMFLAIFASTIALALVGNGPSYAAAPDSININGSECLMTMLMSGGRGNFRGNNGNIVYDIDQLPSSAKNAINNDPELKADYDTINGLDQDTVYPVITLDPKVNTGNNPENCRPLISSDTAHSILYSRPSSPSEFFGVISGSDTLRLASYSAETKQITIASATTAGDNRPVSYNVGGDAALITNEMFKSGGTNIGYCSFVPSGGVYAECMKAAFVDFNTISYRGEIYKLANWRGGDKDPLRYRLDPATSPYTGRKNQLGSCSDKIPYFEIDNDDDSPLDELTADGNDNIYRGLFGNLSSLGSRTTPHNIDYYDADLACNASDKTRVAVYDLVNITRVAQYYPTQKQVAITAKGTSSTGNKEKLLQQTMTQHATEAKIFVGTAIGDCEKVPSVTFDTDPTGATTGYLSATWFTPDPDESCSDVSTKISVKVTPDEVPPPPAGGGGGTGGAIDPDKNCSSEGGPLGFIICPALLVMDEATQKLEEVIREFLFVEPDQFDRNGGGANLYNSWSVFRGLATVIIVIIALVMIFSQAMGEGIFDNYSVKKLLPRLVIAGIGIQLSWFLLGELVNVFNILGNGISGLIMSPFGIDTETNLRDIMPTFEGGGRMVGLVIIGGAAFLGAIVPIALGAAAAIFVGFITLIVRNIIIFLGVVLAPVAIAMSVLPGTQKLSKWWWESLEKALMMYPIVMVLLAAGKIVSKILMDSAGIDPNSSQPNNLEFTTALAAIVAWYIPYFFLPKALQAGGSALSKISGLAGDKSKGMFDKAKGWNDAYKKNKKTRREANAFDPREDRGRLRKILDAKTRTGAYIAGGAIGPGSKFERGNLKVQGAKAAAQKRQFNLQEALDEVKASELKTAVQKAALQFNGVAGPAGVARLITAATSATESVATRQAAVERLITLKDARALDIVSRDDLGKVAFKSASDGGQYSAIKEFAPHMAPGTTGGADNDAFIGAKNKDANGQPVGPNISTNIASAEDMSKWSADTWRLAMQSGNDEIKRRADDILNNEKIKSTISGEVAGILEANRIPRSDRRLKRNIKLVGYQNNFKLYSYQYIWSDVFYVGVMAQDLIDIRPDVLSKDKWGYYHVDYLKLGFELQTLEQWESKQTVKKD